MAYEQNSTRGQDGSTTKVKEDLSAATESARRQVQEKFSEGRETAAGSLDSLAGAVGAAAENLRENNQQGLSRYVTEIADSVASVANSLRNKSVDELVHDVEATARKNPALFIAGSVAIGLAIGRFARASARHGTNFEGSSNFADERYSRNLAGDSYPESAVGYGSERVEEEDYLADDFASEGFGSSTSTGTSTGFASTGSSTNAQLQNDDLSSSDLLSGRTGSGRSGLSERDYSTKQESPIRPPNCDTSSGKIT